MTTDGPAPDPSTGTWHLEDAEAVNRKYPRSFFIPPREHRADIRRGEAARLSFVLGPPRKDPDPESVEQLWVEVTAVDADGNYVARLDDTPTLIGDLGDGDEITFGPEHVTAIVYSADELGYEPGDWAIIDARITEDDEPPLALTFAEPGDSDDGERHWFAALDQQPPEQSAWVQLGELTDRWPELAVVFQMGGGMWRREKSTRTYTQV